MKSGLDIIEEDSGKLLPKSDATNKEDVDKILKLQKKEPQVFQHGNFNIWVYLEYLCYHLIYYVFGPLSCIIFHFLGKT